MFAFGYYETNLDFGWHLSVILVTDSDRVSISQSLSLTETPIFKTINFTSIKSGAMQDGDRIIIHEFLKPYYRK